MISERKFWILTLWFVLYTYYSSTLLDTLLWLIHTHFGIERIDDWYLLLCLICCFHFVCCLIYFEFINVDFQENKNFDTFIAVLVVWKILPWRSFSNSPASPILHKSPAFCMGSFWIIEGLLKECSRITLINRSKSLISKSFWWT